MGMGDILMAAGEARALHRKSGKPVVIVDRANRTQWSELWEGLPYILPAYTAGAIRMVNASGHRPYIALKIPAQWRWKPYKPIPAQVVFRRDELEFAESYRGCVLIEPNVKAIGHDNKAWIWSRWQRVVELMPDVKFVQCLSGGTRVLTGVDHFALTLTFRQALAVLSVCRGFVGTEGGLMHGAAAVGVPGVILWSEFISPAITGYDMHTNIRRAGATCGMRTHCRGCEDSMRAITVEEVVCALRSLLSSSKTNATEVAQ